jgi:hypothetical protein
MPDENWTPSDAYPATLYFHCPNTNCDGHVKLRDRSVHHATRCEKCQLDFAIGADPELWKGEHRPLASVLDHGDDSPGIQQWTGRTLPPWLVLVIGIVFGLVVGILIATHGIT